MAGALGDGLPASAAGTERARQKPHGSNGQPKDTANATVKVVWNARSVSLAKCTKNASKNRLSLTGDPAKGQRYP